MTTVAYFQYTNIPFAGGSYTGAPVIGPITNPNTPACAILYNHTLGVLPGPHSNPPQFAPSNNSSEFSNARHYYWRTAISTERAAAQQLLAKSATSNRFSMSSQRQYPVSTHMNYIPPPSSSQRTAILKSQAVGKTAYNPGRGSTYLVSNKSYDVNDVKTALRMVRSGGCTAPKKKGSIYNTSLRNGKVTPWGGMVRTYQPPIYPLATPQ